MSSSSSPLRPGGSHPIGPDSKKRPWWLLALAVVAAVVVLLLLLSRCGSDDDPPSTGTATAGGSTSGSADPSLEPSPAAPSATASPDSAATATTTPTAAATTPPAASSAATSSTTAPAPAVPGATGSLTAGSASLLPLTTSAPDGSLQAYRGQPVTATGVQVLSVPANEGFWVGTSDTDRIWVQIFGSGESPYRVQTGDLVDFTGSMAKHARGFADRVGVNDSEGAQLLDEQRAHIMATQATLVLAVS